MNTRYLASYFRPKTEKSKDKSSAAEGSEVEKMLKELKKRNG